MCIRDRSKVAYYRHSGLKWQFVNLGGEWFCTLTPDYFYSYDGRRESRFSASYLSGIKKLERNQSVLGETRMWAAFLRFEPNLLDHATGSSTSENWRPSKSAAASTTSPGVEILVQLARVTRSRCSSRPHEDRNSRRAAA